MVVCLTLNKHLIFIEIQYSKAIEYIEIFLEILRFDSHFFTYYSHIKFI